MSIWSSVKGTAIIHKSKNMSLRKVCELVFDEHSLTVDTHYDGDCYIHEFSVVYSEDSDRAYRSAKKFIDYVNQFGMFSECYVEVRFV